MRFEGCLMYWDEDFDVWECGVCGFVTRDDDEAQRHAMTAAQRYLDSVGAED